MFKSALDKISKQVRTARATAAQLAESVGAPKVLTSLLRPEDDAMKKDPWANPRSVQSADASENITPEAHQRAAAPPPAAAAPAPAPAPAAEDSAAAAPPPGSGRLSEATPEDKALGSQVQQLIDDMINPAIAAHGGFITLVNVRGQQVFITMGGGCQGCAASKLTLKAGVERMIREELPEVMEVIDVTDHTMGDNPYYAQ